MSFSMAEVERSSRKHEVIYRYLDFDWKGGYIADISSEELNYNETFETPCLG